MIDESEKKRTFVFHRVSLKFKMNCSSVIQCYVGFILSVVCFVECLKTFQVATSLGNVTGSIENVAVKKADDNLAVLEYVQYLGIPYAEPPVGDLRFKKPVPKGSWNGTHNGTVFGPMCHQGNGHVLVGPTAIVDTVMDEDCLTLDIYAPATSTTEGGGNYAVMVFLFGASGSSKGYIGDALSAYSDVIVVVVNARTHLMGYFSTGDSAAPGNYGLWDQMMAIHWVKDHIVNFGGDSDKITLVGYSMGGSNAILQTLNPSNRGIVKGVVALSGTPFPTYKTSSFLQKPSVKDFVEGVGCTRETSGETVSCLRSKPVEEINNALATLPYTISFTPVVDGEFIHDDPQQMLLSNDTSASAYRDTFASVDLMLGLTNKEGGAHVALMWSDLLSQEMNTFEINKTSFKDVVVPTAMDIVFGENIPNAVLENVVFQYSDLLAPDNKTKIRNSAVDLSTDIDVAAPVVKTAIFHSDNSAKKTYLYQFSANFSLENPLTPSWIDGANHGDDVYFLFGFSQRNVDAWTHTKGFDPKASEIQTSEQWRTLVTNFIKSG